MIMNFKDKTRSLKCHENGMELYKRLTSIGMKIQILECLNERLHRWLIMKNILIVLKGELCSLPKRRTSSWPTLKTYVFPA